MATLLKGSNLKKKIQENPRCLKDSQDTNLYFFCRFKIHPFCTKRNISNRTFRVDFSASDLWLNHGCLSLHFHGKIFRSKKNCCPKPAANFPVQFELLNALQVFALVISLGIVAKGTGCVKFLRSKLCWSSKFVLLIQLYSGTFVFFRKILWQIQGYRSCQIGDQLLYQIASLGNLSFVIFADFGHPKWSQNVSMYVCVCMCIYI